MAGRKAKEFAKKNGIYVNEAERVLAGEITLAEAKEIAKEFDRLVESGEVRLVNLSDMTSALTECVELAK